MGEGNSSEGRSGKPSLRYRNPTVTLQSHYEETPADLASQTEHSGVAQLLPILPESLDAGEGCECRTSQNIVSTKIGTMFHVFLHLAQYVT